MRALVCKNERRMSSHGSAGYTTVNTFVETVATQLKIMVTGINQMLTFLKKYTCNPVIYQKLIDNNI